MNCSLEFVPPALVSAEDIGWLKHATNASFAGTDPSMVLLEAERSLAQIWRFRCDGGGGIVVTRLFEHPKGRELFIWFLGGKGVLAHIRCMHSTLVAFVKSNNCSWMRGIARPGLARIYERQLGFKKRNIEVLQEVE